jgi:hypothetical protein
LTSKLTSAKASISALFRLGSRGTPLAMDW